MITSIRNVAKSAAQQIHWDNPGLFTGEAHKIKNASELFAKHKNHMKEADKHAKILEKYNVL